MKRLAHLDGLRGLAAIAIAFHHSLYILRINEVWGMWHHKLFDVLTPQAKLTQLLLLIFNGRAVVTIFFVLSGYVAFLSLERSNFQFNQTLRYYAKRLVRLYPVYFVVTLLTVLYVSSGFVHRRFDPYSGEWFWWWFNHKITPTEIVRNFLLMNVSLSGVAWSMRVEAFSTLLMPLFFFIVKKTTLVIDVCIALGIALFAFHILKWSDLAFVSMCYMGMTLPKWKNILNKKWLLMLALFLLTVPRMTMPDVYKIIGETTGALILVSCLLYQELPRLKRFLQSRVLQFYGSISYAFFLLHFLVLYISSVIMFNTVPHYFLKTYPLPLMIALAIISILIATPLSWLIHTYVEKPISKLSLQTTLP